MYCIFITMKFSPEENKDFWNKYAFKSKNNPFGAHSDKNIVMLENDYIIEKLQKMKPKSLLDIGCGNGQRTLLFSRYVDGKTLGIDYSDQMINVANSLLSEQSQQITNNVSFKTCDVNELEENGKFDTIISCRIFINQPDSFHQISLFKKLYDHLNPNGSLIMAEESLEGIQRLSKLRKNFELDDIRIQWHNVPIEEKTVLPEISKLFKIKSVKRLGTYYLITRLIHPLLVLPNEPDPNSKINQIGFQIERLLQKELSRTNNLLENYGAVFLAHFERLD